MKTHPILFSTTMVQAILDGRKTMTRRVIKPKPRGIDHYSSADICEAWHSGFIDVECPYGDYNGLIDKASGLLWVRETFGWLPDGLNADKEDGRYYYRANGEIPIKWKPSIFMPRHLSRITLEITDIRVERLQDVSEEDAVNEGIAYAGKGGSGLDIYAKYSSIERFGNEQIGPLISDSQFYQTAKEAFQMLWQSINGEKSWNENPWVWVIEFKPIFKNIDQVLKERGE